MERKKIIQIILLIKTKKALLISAHFHILIFSIVLPTLSPAASRCLTPFPQILLANLKPQFVLIINRLDDDR